MTAPEDQIETLQYSLVGPGRVGASLATWLADHGARLTRIGSRRGASGAATAERLDAHRVEIDQLDSSADDLLLIAVADEALAEVTARLSGRPQAPVALHVSGCVEVEVLAPLRPRGTEIGGLHPLRAFPEASTDSGEAARLVFAIGGDDAARAMARRLVDQLGGVAVRLEDDQRAAYHLAASLAAGGVVTLMATVEALIGSVGLPASVVDGYHGLAHQALEEAARHERSATAITGPVARGDANTIGRHLAALETCQPEAIEVVVALARETLRHLVAHDAAPTNHERIRSILAKSLQRKSFLDRK